MRIEVACVKDPQRDFEIGRLVLSKSIWQSIVDASQPQEQPEEQDYEKRTFEYQSFD